MAHVALKNAIEDTENLLKMLKGNKTIALFTSDPATLHTASIDKWLEDFGLMMRSIEARMPAIREHRNHAIFVNRLPTEILIEILNPSFCEPRSGILANTQNLSSVCRHWKQIFDSTPSLWRTIGCSDHRELVRKALKLSNPYPIELDYTSRAWWKHPSYKVPENYWEDVLPYFARCRSLSLQVGYTSDLRILEGHRAPALESLVLFGPSPSVRGDEEPDDAVDLFGGDAPKLRCLLIQGGVSFKWQSEMLSGLREIKISKTGHFGPSSSALMEIIRRSPQLRVLHLIIDKVPTLLRPQDLQPIHLPCLEDLDLSGHSSPSTDELWSHILSGSPSCPCFTLDITSGDPSSSLITTALENILKTVQPAARTTRGRIIIVPEGPFMVTASRSLNVQSGSYYVGLHLPTAAVTAEMPRIVETLSPLLSDAEVEVRLSAGMEAGNRRWVTWLELMPQISRVVVDRAEQGQFIIQWLSKPFIVNGISKWPLPELTDLDCKVAWKDHSRDVLDMVRSRYSTVVEEDEKQGKETLPKRLNRLRVVLAGRDRQVRAEIVRIVGEGHVELK